MHLLDIYFPSSLKSYSHTQKKEQNGWFIPASDKILTEATLNK